MSTVRSHQDDGGTTVGVQLAQGDIDRLEAGLPVEIEPDEASDPVTSVHIAKDRRDDPALTAVPETDAAEWHSI